MYQIILFIILFFSFNYAEMLRPANEAQLSHIHILFEWGQVPNAIQYEVQVSETEVFENLIINITTNELLYKAYEHFDWGQTFYWKIRPYYGDGVYGDWLPSYVFSIGIAKLNQIDVNSTDFDAIYDGLMIFGNIWQQQYPFSAAYDKSGKEIWNDDNLMMLNHINQYGQMYGHTWIDWPDRTGLHINFRNEVLWQGPEDTTIDIHEIKQIPNGNYMAFVPEIRLGPIPLGEWTTMFRALGYEADGVTLEFPWVGQKIVEFDKYTKEVLWVWDPFNHFTMDDYDAYGGTWWNALQSGNYDWLHSNAFHFDNQNQVIYFSSRHLSRITKIDYPDGEVIWMMGPSDEYMASGNEHICTDIGFSFQHNIQLLNNGHLLFFDNGNLSELFNDDDFMSRALEIDVIDDSYCEIIWEYILPDTFYGPWMGSVQLLPNDNYLINTVGNRGTVLEIASNSQFLMMADYNLDENPAGNYRTYKIPSIFPDAFYVIFDNYVLTDIEGDDFLGIVIPEGENSFRMTLYNNSGYDQYYHYSISDSQNWFGDLSETVFLLANESTQISFETEFCNTNSSQINLIITPIAHEYAQKVFNHDVYRLLLDGDVNQDGGLNVLDIVLVVNVILGISDEMCNMDVNGDEYIDILDIISIINIILDT